jgi:hypothetical protein
MILPKNGDNFTLPDQRENTHISFHTVALLDIIKKAIIIDN